MVGLGNAGKRHANLIRELDFQVDTASRRDNADFFFALESGELPLNVYDFVVIATETKHHEQFLSQADFGDFRGRVLVEKPGLLSTQTMRRMAKVDARVAFNLRYLEGIRWMKSALRNAEVYRASARAHSFLPNWRPDSSERSYYSERTSDGGGALLDLSHELDYLTYLFEDWAVITAMGGRVGNVTHDADDTWTIAGRSQNGAHISLSLSLISQLEVRDLVVDTNLGWHFVDLVNGTFGDSNGMRHGNKIEDTYALMIKDFALTDFAKLPTLAAHRTTLAKIYQARTLAEDV